MIVSSNFAKLLWPGLNKIHGQAYNEHSVEFTDLFDMYTSKKAFEEDLGITSFGLAQKKSEGSPISYDDENQAFLTRYQHIVYGLGFIITREMVEDDQYAVVGQRRSKALAFSMRQTKEIIAANVYNRAFNSSYTGGDGVEMLSTAHINHSGGTWSNELAVAADLSEASLEQACIDIMKLKNDRGLNISIMPQTLIVAPDNVFEAERILKSTLRSGTADNDVNALARMGKFPGGVKVNHYLTDADAWFIRTNAPDGLKCFKRRAMEFTVDNDYDTENAKYKSTERYSFGWTDPRAIFGSPGA